ncbi:MAG: mannose-1-phosphate guanylyltransferase [Candidatus Saccharimonadales bacterium]
MIIVIVAGGSGTRLWPLSTPDYPKHLLKVNGDSLSLLQQTYARAKKLTDKVYVVSEAGHIQHVKEQLSELPEDAFIVEPGRRGTANCILAALSHIAKKHDGNEPIASIHADHYIRDIDGFMHSFETATETSAEQKRLVLVGVEPDYAATGFGYIEKGQVISEQSFVFNVSSFKEKPDFEIARRYLRSGKYLWNCGYFVGSLNTFIDSMQQYAPDLYQNYQKLADAPPEDYQNVYLGLENQAIDYALIEKVKNLLVVPASFDWMDLGSFDDLSKAVSGDESGNYAHGKSIELEAVNNSFVHNAEKKPIAIIGLDNVVVINTAHGMLVARKDQSQKVGEVSKRLLLT